MNFTSDIITYIRRIIKSSSNADIKDDLIIDYINRFLLNDVDARIQLFDLKTKYQFQTTPGVDRYNMPLYDVQTESGGQKISSYPVYQGFFDPCYVNGVRVAFQTQKNAFFNSYPNIVQRLVVVATGNGTTGPYTFQLPILSNSVPLNPPVSGIIRGHIDITGIISTGANKDPPTVTSVEIANLDPFIERVPVTSVDSAFYLTSTDIFGANVIVADSGQFLASNQNYGLLMSPGKAPYGNLPLVDPSGTNYSTTANTINYVTGECTVNFPTVIPNGVNINCQCYWFQSGLPTSILYYNNVITLRAPPATQNLVEMDAYLTPAAFFATNQAAPFGYMCEYIARGAARKILSDTGDIEQFNFYESLFKEQEMLVWKRSQRQFTSTRTQTIYSQGMGYGNSLGNNNNGGTL